MCVIAAFFAHVFRISLGRPCTDFLFIRQEVRAICKTRNQLLVKSSISGYYLISSYETLSSGFWLLGTPSPFLLHMLLRSLLLHTVRMTWRSFPCFLSFLTRGLSREHLCEQYRV